MGLRSSPGGWSDSHEREQIIIGVEAEDVTTFSEEYTPPIEAAIRRVVEDTISLVG